ncbi:cytochrome c551 [Heyndrickxia sporothermodurans]|uniref:cytochrome c551 n=1 Tax=Heyndrickxia sporothermodurans TaxID=46224 RepID=UPI003D19F89D
MVKKLIGILMIFTLAFGLAACGSSSKDNNNDNANKNETTTNTNKSTNTASAGDAEKLFSQNCASCHGGNLEGAVGPNLTKVGAKYNKDQILDIINKGKSGGMPGGLFKGDDADKVATWLSEKK